MAFSGVGVASSDSNMEVFSDMAPPWSGRCIPARRGASFAL
jgi:hypothetical protein